MEITVYDTKTLKQELESQVLAPKRRKICHRQIFVYFVVKNLRLKVQSGIFTFYNLTIMKFSERIS